MPYVDGFILAIPKANIEAYKKMATLGGEWVEFSECAMAWMLDCEAVM